MEEIFGPITPFFIMGLVTLIVQYLKNNWQQYLNTDRKIQLAALVVSMIFLMPYSLLTAGAITWLVVYSAVIYSLYGWLVSIGLYEIYAKQFRKE